ncbi:DnaJ-domain-containing protein [Melanomma pulvis-pyrius CBS 109.77]|uniref:DnaJ-domain-containing protein n=1 Tax=Melanomma pulvis-pyrius CBS 109.77 TaxID=1314802 RepID=A0A6A6XP76_9PLEO|nr:DnaJ-domain-containing protein [Melanomma pulvis-pyrius CBS 109.77]
MESTLPPDPYKALGLGKDVDAATIKATYRKLVLKCHPDKVKDETLKQQKQEEFHKIQQAYELIGDEDKRKTYDAEVRLDYLRREKLSRSGPHIDVKTGRYEVRTAAPAGATFSASGPSRYEERKTSRSFDEDRFYDERARKYDTYDAYPKHSSSTRTTREKEVPIKVTRVSSDRTRSDQKKTRDREERRDRSGKFVHMEDEVSSNDEKARYEAEYRRRSNDARKLKDEEDARKAAAEARRKADLDRPFYEEPRYDRQRKQSEQESEAMRHILRTKTAEVSDPRPAANRTSSSRDVRPEMYDRSSRRDRESVRRSSARPKEPRPTSRDRDRKGMPEIVDWGDDDRSPPSFKHSSSSPADLHVPRVTPQRSYTESSSRDHRRTETSPSPAFRRSETMPSSSRRKEATPARPSHLRSSEKLAQHEPLSRSPESAFPTVPPPQSASKKYYYPTPQGGVRLSPEDVNLVNGHRTVIHEPTRHRTHSPTPISRPPMGSNRPSDPSIQYQPTGPKLSVPPPPLGRSATMNVAPIRVEERGRSRPALYGEIPKRENARRQNSFSPDTVSYSRKILPDDIRWSRPREPEKDREYAKPTLSRHATVDFDMCNQTLALRLYIKSHLLDPHAARPTPSDFGDAGTVGYVYDDDDDDNDDDDDDDT